MHKYGIQGHATINRWYNQYERFKHYSLKTTSFMKIPKLMNSWTRTEVMLNGTSKQFFRMESEDKATILEIA